MKFIAIASYYASGSSAVTDLLKEFSNVRVPEGGLEWRFLQDPDGVRALEYNIIEHNHRHNTSHAIKRFKWMCELTQKKWYRISVGKDFIEATNRYIDSITELKCETNWHYDNFEKSILYKIFSRMYYITTSKINQILNVRLNTNLMNYTHELGYFTAISQKDFYAKTQRYIEEVFSKWNDREYIVADQLIPASNVLSYFSYFAEEPKVIVVDRDPRDIFLESRELNFNVPPKKIEEYCVWYELIRRHRQTEVYPEDKVMLLQFEDLIYHYDATVKKIMDFIGLARDSHTAPKTEFIPEVSIKNTNKALHHPEMEREIAYIESTLKKYLYDFHA